MIDLKQSLAVLAAVLATTAFASPSYAQQNGRELSHARAQAIQQCSRKAAPYWEWNGRLRLYIPVLHGRIRPVGIKPRPVFEGSSSGQAGRAALEQDDDG